MHWEEKIDILKKEFSPLDFGDHFTDWTYILKKIESKFFYKNDPNFNFTNWADNIKNKVFLRTINTQTIYEEIKNLDTNTNYWVVVVISKNPTTKQYVYDCKTNAIRSLLTFSHGDFYIIDKKYLWLTYFQIDSKKEEITIFKSGHERTPFDK